MNINELKKILADAPEGTTHVVEAAFCIDYLQILSEKPLKLYCDQHDHWEVLTDYKLCTFTYENPRALSNIEAIVNQTERIMKLEQMIDNGIGWEDMERGL